MRCKACEFENREGRKFCASCGSALPAPCPDCGYANEGSDRYCGGCGRLLAVDAAAPARPDRLAVPQGDRRPVTVLFCDLVGYTRLSSQLDPEDVHTLLERFFTTVDAIVERFGGTIDKHIGDATMALFGAPVAHGNDVERAVRAALEIQAAVPKLGSGLASPLAIHIGVAMGEVIASSVGGERHRGYTVTGEAANLAARLLARASSGETLVSDAVYRATSHAIAYESVGSLTLKGLDRPVDVWRLIGASIAAAHAQALVGRSSEMAQFRAVLDACIEGTSGSVIRIRGEAGIGKTRLMDELRSAASASGMATHTGLVLDFGMERGQGAVRTVVAGLIGLGLSKSPDAVESRSTRPGGNCSCSLMTRSIYAISSKFHSRRRRLGSMRRWMRPPGRRAKSASSRNWSRRTQIVSQFSSRSRTSIGPTPRRSAFSRGSAAPRPRAAAYWR